MSEANEALLRRFLAEIVNRGNFAVLDELVHPDYIYRGSDETFHGPEALQELISAYRAAFPDLTAHVEDLIASEDKVAIAVTLTGTHQGELMGVPATGKSISVSAMLISRVEDGRIIEEREIVDQLTMFKQLGLIPEDE